MLTTDILMCELNNPPKAVYVLAFKYKTTPKRIFLKAQILDKIRTIPGHTTCITGYGDYETCWGKAQEGSRLRKCYLGCNLEVTCGWQLLVK